MTSIHLFSIHLRDLPFSHLPFFPSHHQPQSPLPPPLTFIPGCVLHSRIMASSALMVFPLPVGAPSSTLQSVWNSVWKACV